MKANKKTFRRSLTEFLKSRNIKDLNLILKPFFPIILFSQFILQCMDRISISITNELKNTYEILVKGKTPVSVEKIKQLYRGDSKDYFKGNNFPYHGLALKILAYPVVSAVRLLKSSKASDHQKTQIGKISNIKPTSTTSSRELNKVEDPKKANSPRKTSNNNKGMNKSGGFHL